MLRQINRITPIIVLAGLVLTAAPSEAQMQIVSEKKPATLIRTDEYILRSDVIGRDFIVEVTQAENLRAGEKAAVIYALDGGFGLVGTTTRMLTSGNRMTPAFVVSIGYPHPNGRNLGPRNTDLLHDRVQFGAQTIGGGGEAFESFLMKEVRPFVEARYPIDPTRAVLIGHSGGALFAANILVRRPESFSAYLIGSIPITSYDPAMPDKVRGMAANGGGRRVFVGWAPDDVTRLASDRFGPALAAGGSTFDVRQAVFAEDSHSSAYLPLLMQGLPFVLPTALAEGEPVKVSANTIDRYVGRYTS